MAHFLEASITGKFWIINSTIFSLFVSIYIVSTKTSCSICNEIWISSSKDRPYGSWEGLIKSACLFPCQVWIKHSIFNSLVTTLVMGLESRLFCWSIHFFSFESKLSDCIKFLISLAQASAPVTCVFFFGWCNQYYISPFWNIYFYFTCFLHFFQ